jgi:menaquinone-dependent protoporphyrinogen oxidase
MAKILIAYGTTEGQTAKIAHHIADAARRLGHGADVAHVSELGPTTDLDAYDAAIVGASVHEGRYQAAVVHFIEQHKRWLGARPSAFFSVSLAAASRNPGEVAEIQRYISELAQHSGWKPDSTDSFAGALKYTQYSWLKRALMKHISQKEGGDIDTSRDFEYTDWSQVTRFAERFCAKLPTSKR